MPTVVCCHCATRSPAPADGTCPACHTALDAPLAVDAPLATRPAPVEPPPTRRSAAHRVVAGLLFGPVAHAWWVPVSLTLGAALALSGLAWASSGMG